MIDASQANRRDEALDEAVIRLAAIAARTPVPSVDSPELDALQAEFDALWVGQPIRRDGSTALTCEERMLRLAMREAGYKRVSVCTLSGWDIHYEGGETFPMPFSDDAAAEYRAAISVLRSRD